MGKTAHDGPLFGAKATLFSAGPVSASTGSSAIFAGTIIPAGEDWLLTDVAIYRNSTGSTDFTVSVHYNSTLAGSVGVGGSSIVASNIARFTADGGEYQGLKVLSGSTVTLSHSSHAGPNANVTVVLSGYRRWKASTTYTE
jgi:hypothetical protein